MYRGLRVSGCATGFPGPRFRVCDSHQFEVSVEPEAMSYGLSATGKIVLTFRDTDAMTVELTICRMG